MNGRNLASYGRRISHRFCTSSTSSKSTVDPKEIKKFSDQAGKWWDPKGSVIERNVAPNRQEQKTTHGLPLKPLSGIDVIDVGCGGGLVAEPMARLGAKILGIDKSREGILVARQHAAKDPEISSTDVLRYREAAVEDVVNAGESFDVVLALEIIEHVAEPAKFLKHCSSLVREGGVLILSTLNRTVTSYALGIIAVERVLGWLPAGTHDWTRFPTPEEVADVIKNQTELVPEEVVGVAYSPFSRTFSVVDDLSVNYMFTAARPITPPTDSSSASAKTSHTSDSRETG
ncbi:Methyltransferase [Gracilaria domingensis]|nr:Methyltransferase [Gracilaria domingensis]